MRKGEKGVGRGARSRGGVIDRVGEGEKGRRMKR